MVNERKTEGDLLSFIIHVGFRFPVSGFLYLVMSDDRTADDR
jgi:hypothetical protein